MINYFVVRAKQGTLRAFLQRWPNRARDLFRIVPYDSIPRLRGATPGVFIFSDIDRLRSEQVNGVERLCDLLAEQMGSSIVLNHPRGLLRRLGLLQGLWADGVNRFRAFPADALPGDIRFPVFLRRENEHNGPATGLLHDMPEYRDARPRFDSLGANIRDLMAVEFCDTRGPDGLYRKYSAFRIGDRIIPGHVLFSRDWVARDSGPEPLRDEERDYLVGNPHRVPLLRFFDRARITYGRIDYGLLDGAIQVWEINTNPVLIQGPERYSADKLPLKRRLVDELSEAFLALHDRVRSVGMERVPIPRALFAPRSGSSRTWLRRRLFGFEV